MFVINDYYKLNVLHRFIFETKFLGSMDNPVGDGSGLIADIVNEIGDAIVAHLEGDGKLEEAKEYRDWYVLSKVAIGYSRIKERIQANKDMSNYDLDQKVQCIKGWAAPYVIPDDIMNEFLEMCE